MLSVRADDKFTAKIAFNDHMEIFRGKICYFSRIWLDGHRGKIITPFAFLKASYFKLRCYKLLKVNCYTLSHLSSVIYCLKLHCVRRYQIGLHAAN